jgi:hypothetical protein
VDQNLKDNLRLVIMFEMKDWSEGANPERALDMIGLLSTVIGGALNIQTIVLRGEKQDSPTNSNAG